MKRIKDLAKKFKNAVAVEGFYYDDLGYYFDVDAAEMDYNED